MTCFAIGEPQYECSNWYKRIFGGLLNEKKQKRFMLILLSCIEELDGFFVTENDVLFVIGSDAAWLDEITDTAKTFFQNRIIVMGNHTPGLGGKTYSVVTGDISKDMNTLYTHLKSCGSTKICLYGVNPNSTSDKFKEEAFFALEPCKDNVFYNRGSLVRCFEDFSKRQSEFDGCICVNDFAAISLISHLENKESIYIASYGGNSLVTMHKPAITHVKSNLDCFASAGLDLAKILCKNKNINSVIIYISSTFVTGETTGTASDKQFEKVYLKSDAENSGDKLFYSDEEVKRLIKIETLLSSLCDPDFIIVELLLEGNTYEEIASRVNMSVNGIKYKLKNMFEICQVKTRQEFCTLLRQLRIF